MFVLLPATFAQASRQSQRNGELEERLLPLGQRLFGKHLWALVSDCISSGTNSRPKTENKL